MKKQLLKIILGVFICIVALHINSKTGMKVKAEVKPEYMQDVPLDGAHFPDEHVRDELKRWVDQNKDGILSREEREKVCYLYLNCVSGSVISNSWYTDMKYISEPVQNQEDQIIYSKGKHSLELGLKSENNNNYKGGDGSSETIDLRGIEYFFNLEEVKINKYELVSGSFKNNVNLKKIWIGCSKTGQRSYGNITGDFPVSQLTYMHLENIDVHTLDVKEIPELQVLRVIFPEGSNRRLTALDLSKNKKLKELEFGHILPGRLDLRGNPKLKTLKLYTGQGKVGQKYGGVVYRHSDAFETGYYQSYSRYEYYLPEKDQNCKVVFPKKNQIQKLYYFTRDKKIDISMLTKLNDFQTLKTTKAKVKSGWIRKTFTKKKWGCAVTKGGKFVKKIKAEKKKKYTMI